MQASDCVPSRPLPQPNSVEQRTGCDRANLHEIHPCSRWSAGVPPIESLTNPEVRALAIRARDFVEAHTWCAQVTDVACAFTAAGALGVFRVDLEPLGNGDPIVWTVVGDLPPAYLPL